MYFDYFILQFYCNIQILEDNIGIVLTFHMQTRQYDIISFKDILYIDI